MAKLPTLPRKAGVAIPHPLDAPLGSLLTKADKQLRVTLRDYPNRNGVHESSPKTKIIFCELRDGKENHSCDKP